VVRGGQLRMRGVSIADDSWPSVCIGATEDTKAHLTTG
jgi:hypothetical protein